jgi:hypothetical protein
MILREANPMQYVFLFARTDEELEYEPTVLNFPESATPLVPLVGDRVEYGSPVIVGNVRSRVIQFMDGNPIKTISVVFMVDQDKTIFTGGTPKRTGFPTEPPK